MLKVTLVLCVHSEGPFPKAHSIIPDKDSSAHVRSFSSMFRMQTGILKTTLPRCRAGTPQLSQGWQSDASRSVIFKMTPAQDE